LPTSSVVSGATSAVCVTPEEECAAFAVRTIDNTAREILVGGYGLTTGSGIVEGLVRAKGSTATSGLRTAKIMIIDGALTLTGYMNWIRGAAANAENLNLVSSPAVAAAYTAHWSDRLALSVRFNQREDWCRDSSTAAH
jgi:hypothetical protein